MRQCDNVAQEPSRQAEQLLGQAQMYQQQMQGILVQKENLKLQFAEIEKALEELGKSKETSVYKISGPILIKTSSADLKKELTEKRELISTRMKSLEDGEKRLTEKLEGLRDKLTKTEGK